MKKIVLLSEFTPFSNITYSKSPAGLRLAYICRNAGCKVLSIHNSTYIPLNTIKEAINKFTKGEEYILGISTSFIFPRTTSWILKQNNTSINDEENYEGNLWENNNLWEWMTEICTYAKNTNATIVLGGWWINSVYLSSTYDRASLSISKLSTLVDYFVEGTSGDVLINLAKNIKPSINNIKDIPYKLNYVRDNDIQDFSDAAMMITTPQDIVLPYETGFAEIAAGCVFSCHFCTYAALGKKKNEFMRSYESFEREIKFAWDNYNIRSYGFVDNIVNDNMMKLDWLIKIRNKLGIDLEWSGYVRLDTISNPDQVKKLVDSGCKIAIMGIESFNKETGPTIGKLTDGEKIKEKLRMFRKTAGNNIFTLSGFIIGLPYESEEKIRETDKWLKSDEGRELLDHYKYRVLKLYPNQDTKNEINTKRTSISNDPWKMYKRINSQMWSSPWMDSKKAVEIRDDMLDQDYIPNYMRNFRDFKPVTGKSFSEMLTYYKSLKTREERIKFNNILETACNKADKIKLNNYIKKLNEMEFN